MAKKQKTEGKGLLAVAKAEKKLRKAQEAVVVATRRLAKLVPAAAAAAAPAPAAPATRAAAPKRAAAATKARMKSTPAKTSASVGVVELREQAKARGIVGYSRLPKAALLLALAK